MRTVDRPSLEWYLSEHLSHALVGVSSCVSQMTSGWFAIMRADIDLQLPAAKPARLCSFLPHTQAPHWGSETYSS